VGHKPSNFNQMNRPESGGTDRNDVHEKSGIAERDKQRFASQQAHERREEKPKGDATGDHGDMGDVAEGD
jgi:hypothetical protein